MAYKVYLALIGIPKTWRAIIIPNNYTFSDLHMSVQSAMGWSNAHLYEFKLYNKENNNNVTISEPDEFFKPNSSFMDSRMTRLSEVFSESILYTKYIYDFGDYWEHWLKITEIPDIVEYTQLPVCCSGNGICPPENIGGVDEYLFQRTCSKNTNNSHLDLTCFDEQNISFWGVENKNISLPIGGHKLWIRRLILGNMSITDLVNDLCSVIPVQDIREFYEAIISKPLKVKNKATIILCYKKGMSIPFISEYLFISERTIYDLIERYKCKGVQQSIFNKKKGFKHERQEYIDKVFAILHAPPSSYGFNRTSWRKEDIKEVMTGEGMPINKDAIAKIIKNAGYSYRKAKITLTSNDPDYKEKLAGITKILSGLKENEKFFSIDEYGPFAIKIQGGKSLVPAGTYKSVPQWQKNKGSLILTAALELSTNQITHFYSEKKNTEEMIKLLNVLLQKYSGEKTIYFSWDAASWHASKALNKAVDEINSPEYRKTHKCPEIVLAPLPTCAQFLNVIESVFSGMARAIIHNSNYQSVDECMKAIDKYYEERNDRFFKTPKRAGNKIWGKERVKASFSESNNCKDPKYR